MRLGRKKTDADEPDVPGRIVGDAEAVAGLRHVSVATPGADPRDVAVAAARKYRFLQRHWARSGITLDVLTAAKRELDEALEKCP